jgi:HAD superfamily hydrolase (TIGR01509 family)
VPKAIIFDYYGVISADGGMKDQAVLDYILELRKTYKVGLLTNVGSGNIQKLFTPSEQACYFDAAASSGDIGAAKPEVRAYEYIAGQLGVRTEDCIMVDDRELCCTGAIEAGMQAILYTNVGDLQRQLSRLAYEQRAVQ